MQAMLWGAPGAGDIEIAAQLAHNTERIERAALLKHCTVGDGFAHTIRLMTWHWLAR
jgi:hypothetical protein